MPNQMIALQSRNPQLPDPASQTARYANMMNMAKQQEAAQRQALLAQQTMDINAAEEGRRVALQPSALAKAEGDAGVAKIKYFMDFVKASANDIANSSTPEQAIARGERLKQQFTDPALQARIDETIGELVSDPSKFEENRKRILIRTLDTKDQFAESHSDIFDAKGDLLNKVTSPIGAFSTRITPGVVTDLPSTATQAPPPRATPTAGAGTSAPVRATQGSNTTPQDLRDQGMNPRNIPSGMPTSPASFTGGMGGAGAAQITPEVMSRIVDSAFQTGVMAQVDFDQLLATQPPENRQAFTDAFRRANVTLQADAPSLADSGMGQQQMAANPVQRPQSQFADLRSPAPQSQTAGLRGAPPVEQTLAQYRVGDPIRGRANIPTSANVPIERVRQEAVAGRETAEEVYNKEKARARAQREAAIEAGPKPLTPVQEQKLRATITKDYKTVNDTLDQMLNPVTGVVAAVNSVRKLSKSQKEWLVGKTNYLPSLTDAGQTADTRLGNLTGKVTQMGKVLASLGGAIGPMAVQEWNIVRSFIADLDPAQMSPQALEDQLDLIEAAARGAAERISDAYNNQYIEEFARYPNRFEIKGPTETPVKKNPAESQLPRIKTDAQWNALKPGTLYIAPNGETKRKR